MALLNILKEGDPTLRKVSRKVEKITPRILTLLDDMHETLDKAEGIGLAAPQVGVLRRIVIVEIGDKRFEMINPEIIETRGVQEELEACLSVPELYGRVKRPAWVKVRAADRNGNVYEAEGDGLLARCFCHEIEHLDGHLFSEHIDHFLSDEELEDYLNAEQAEAAGDEERE